LGEPLGLISRRRIHDRRSSGRILEKTLHDVGAIAWVSLDDLDANVRAAKSMNEARRSTKPELTGDVILHRGRCGCGERDHRCRSKQRKTLTEHAVVRAEVMTPLRNAMRFIDRHERGLATCEHLWKARHLQALGCDEEEIERAI